MELDQQVFWPVLPVVAGAGTAGDNVIYSSRRGDVVGQDPGDIRGARRLKGWYTANQASTFAVQVLIAGTWTTIGDTVSVAANDICNFNVPRPVGTCRLIVNFAVAPTTFNHSSGIVLCNDAAQEVTV